MRNFLLAFTFTLTFSNIYSQNLIPFSIEGKFTSDTLTGTIYFYYPKDGKWIMDSCRIKKGRFSFSGKLIHPVLGRLVYNDRTKEIFLEPTSMNILCKDEQLEHVKTTGSLSDTEFNKIDLEIQKINNRWQSVMDTLSTVNKKSNEAFQELKSWVLKPYFEEVREIYLAFFEHYPQSYVTAYFLASKVIKMNQGSLSFDSLKGYYDKFGTSLKDSWYGRIIRKDIAKKMIAVPGTHALDFTKTDLNGQLLSLSSFHGKFVLLDFWGSWCVPCRKANPHLKELYLRYKVNGFDIIGIAADNNTKNAWRKAIVKDGLPWHQILVDELEAVYNVTSYPTKILIDKQGIIIGRFEAEEKELDEKLDSIFSKNH